MNIPFEKYLNVRVAYAPSFSPEGARLAFLTNITGVPQVWAVEVRDGASAPRWPDQLTFGADRVLGAWYSPARAEIIFSRDSGGNENAQFFLINDDGSDERRLTFDEGAQHLFGGWSRDGKQFCFSANRRDRGRYDIYVQHIDSTDAQMVWQNDTPGILAPTDFSPDDSRVLVVFLHGSLDHDLYEVNVTERAARHLTPHIGVVRYAYPVSPQYSADGKSIYCASDVAREFMGIGRLDLSTLAYHPIAQPEAEVEFLAVSTDEQYLAYASNNAGSHTITLRDLESGATRELSSLPMGVVSPPPDGTGLIFSNRGQQLAFAFSASTRTSDIWVWDLKSDTLTPITRSSHAGVPVSTFVEPQLVHYPSFDGRKIPAWFFAPTRETDDGVPVVVYVHGGPEGQTQPMFFPLIQYLVQRGYAVLAPNVRGSTGFGKAYSHLDDVEKRMDSVADLAHAAYWLREQPLVDGNRIAVYGGSYGGFMVLAALTTYPELWAAGVDIVGISNFVTFLENTSAYRRSSRESEYGSLERDRELLTRISPIHYVDKVRAPLMVIHGANDPRVPLGETEQIVNALKSRNVPVEFLVYPDEGHGIVKLTNKLDAFPKVAEFLDRHLAPK